MPLTGGQKRDGLILEVQLIQIYTRSHIAWVSSLKRRGMLAEESEGAPGSAFPVRTDSACGVPCCGLGGISSLYHPAGPHCHTADLGYLNLTKLSGLPILMRERLKLDRYFWTIWKSSFIILACALLFAYLSCKNYNSQSNLDFEVFVWMQNSRRALEYSYLSHCKKPQPSISQWKEARWRSWFVLW